MGTRLRDVHAHSPKGLLQVGGVPIVQRSLALLAQHGIERAVVVTGHMREAYEGLVCALPIELVHNPHFATTGSMASLACALEIVSEDFLLLESDLVYEAAALTAVLAHPAPDVVLTSGPTGAGDEVWVQGTAGKLQTMDKDRSRLSHVDGEFVGINRISAALAATMVRRFAGFERRHGHGRMSYETDALVQAVDEHDVALALQPDLLWGEIDDARHDRRIVQHVWPALRRLSTAQGSTAPSEQTS